MQLQSLLQPVEIPVDIEIPSADGAEIVKERLRLKVKPLTPNLVASLPDAADEQLAALLLDWDLESDGEKMPATLESVRLLPFDLVADLTAQIRDFFHRRAMKSLA